MHRYLFTISHRDIGKTTVRKMACHECDRVETIYIGSAIGRIQPIDVGKRVFDVDGVIQVENDAQRNERERRRVRLDLS